METHEASPVEIHTGESPFSEVVDGKRKLSKEQVISLLKKHGVRDVDFLENESVSAEQIIPSVRQAKIKVAEGFFRELSREVRLPFVPADEVKKKCKAPHECHLVAILPYSFLRENLILPMQLTKTTARLVTSNPLNTKAMSVLECLLGERRIDWYVASIDAVEGVIEKVYREIHKKQALWDLYYRNPDESATKILLRWQKCLLVGVSLAILAACVMNFSLTFLVVFSTINVFYFSTNPIKFYISIRGLQGSRKIAKVSEEELKSLDAECLPTYTILVPVFHESRVLAQVMNNIYRMDYPKEKLDVKILIEEKDDETLEEAKKLGLFGAPEKNVEAIPAENYREFLKVFDPVVIPRADITTKPRACNYGLYRAKGEYCVIYDAEDKPDEDQLKKAAIVFSRSEEELACLQSRLNFYNAKENLLSRWFSIEYSYWYDYYLEGLDRVDAPIPLGGTSNHFRTKQLRELGSWDPYNVTEDADLGIRISRRNLRTEMIDCYTYEEAPIKLWSWIRQRSRWYKGHLQTYLVHMRHPRKLFEDLGWRKSILFQLTFGGGIFVPIMNPILWATTLATMLFPNVFPYMSFFPLQQICLFNLIVGNLVYILLYVMACAKKRKYSSIPLSAMMPAYWMLISIGAWRGLVQLITKPFYWEKTTHGVSHASNAKTTK
jgi:cellulose synthase/poly-beta-1,6-N-acetylglucosamine synthase-like glycosyltransferase